MKRPALEKKPLKDHLLELRLRLLWSILSLLIGTAVGYFLYSTIVSVLVSPLNKPLFYSSPAGGFDFVLKISLFFGFIVSVPVFLYHSIQFVSPIIPYKPKYYLLKLLLVSCILMSFGIGFAYLISLPAALHFLGGFGSDKVQSLIFANEYFSFITRYLAGFGLLFQLPLVLYLINAIVPLQPRSLMKKQRYVIVLSFVVAAIITPTPDLFNQTLMALPIILLYQVAILTIWIANKRQKREYFIVPNLYHERRIVP